MKILYNWSLKQMLILGSSEEYHQLVMKNLPDGIQGTCEIWSCISTKVQMKVD